MDTGKIIGLAALAMLFAAPVFAADMPVKAPPAQVTPASSWTGVYLGIEGGGGWGRSEQHDISASSGVYDQRGALFGGTLGVNWQSGIFLLGAEADLSWTNINGSIHTGVCGGSVCFTNMKWLTTERGRAGLLFGAQKQFLVYVTGGLADTRFDTGQGACPLTLCGVAHKSAATVGGGVEAMLGAKLSVKLEYLYANFGSGVVYNPGSAIMVPERVNILRAGLNWHL